MGDSLKYMYSEGSDGSSYEFNFYIIGFSLEFEQFIDLKEVHVKHHLLKWLGDKTAYQSSFTVSSCRSIYQGQLWWFLKHENISSYWNLDLITALILFQ